MKRMFILCLVIATLMMGTIIMSAQQGQRIAYYTFGFANVAGNNTAAYIDFQKNTVRKIIQERMKTEQILDWSVNQVIYRGLPESQYNFVTVTGFSGPPTQAGQGVVQTATGMTAADLAAKFGPLATNVGNELTRGEAGTAPVAIQEGNVVTVVSWKIAPQRGADYGRYVQTMLLPLNAQGVKDGRFLAWGAVRVVSPGGGDAPVDAMTATFYKDVASALPSTPPNANEGQMNFTKAFPNQNFSAFVDQGRDVRRNVRSEMWRVVTSVQRPATGSR